MREACIHDCVCERHRVLVGNRAGHQAAPLLINVLVRREPSPIAREVGVLNGIVVGIETGDTSESGLENMPSANWCRETMGADERSQMEGTIGQWLRSAEQQMASRPQ